MVMAQLVKGRLNQIFRGERLAALILLTAQVLAAFAAFLVNLFAARILDPTDRGDLAFALQIAYFMTVFMLMGVERPFVSTRKGNFNSEFRNFFFLIAPAVMVITPITVVVVYLSPISGKWVGVGFVVVALFVFLNGLSRGVRISYIVSRNWKVFAVNAISSQLIIITGAVVFTILGVENPVAWMALYLASGLPALILLIVSLLNRGPKQPIEEVEKRRIRKNGWILFPSDFSNTAMMRSDRLFLPIFGTSADLGLYVTVATVMEISGWPVKQWVDASLRKWGEAKNEMYSAINGLLFKSFLFLTLLSLGLGLVAYVILELFLPESYAPAKGVIIPLAIASVIFGLTRVQQGLMVAFGAAARVSIVEIIGTIVSIMMYVLLIPKFGMYGAAYGSIVGYSACYLCSVFTLTKLRRKEH